MKALHDEHRPGEHGTEPQARVLSDAEFSRRCSLLDALRARLSAAGTRCVLARHQRLVLSSAPGHGASGKTDPALHIFGPDNATAKARTDGDIYRLDSGEEFPVSDPANTAARICKALGRAAAHPDEPPS